VFSAASQAAKCHGLRTHLIALVAAALLPAFAVGAIAVAAAVDTYRQSFERRLESTAQALASAVDTEIAGSFLALSTLATARTLNDETELAAFHERARRAAAILGTRIFLIAPDASVILHTDEPFGTPPRPLQPDSAALARAVFTTGRPAVGNLVRGQRTGEPLAPIYVPVSKDGTTVSYALGSVVESKRISSPLGKQAFREGGYAGLTDGTGKIVARSADHERYIGQQVREWVMDGVEASAGGILRGRNLTGVEITTAFRHLSKAPGWFITVAEPRSTYLATLWPPLATLAIGGLGTVAAALFLALKIGGRVLGPVDQLTREAETVASNGGKLPPASGQTACVIEFVRLQRAVRSAEEALAQRTAAIAAGEARLRAVVDTAVDAILVIDEAGILQSFNRAAETIFGYAADEVVGRNVSVLMGADEAARHDGYIGAYLSTGERKIIGTGREVEGRRKDGSRVPLDLAIAEWRDGEGKRFFTGIMRDISARKADEARQALLVREVDHRAKNALAVVQSVLRLTPANDAQSFVAAVEARVAALARAHSLLAEGGWSGADLRAVAERELAPYATPRRGATAAAAPPPEPQVSLDGPPLPLSPAAVQPFAMVLHELATNAAKHGALSAAGGRVELRWRAGRRAGDDGRLRLRWAETGGPRLAAPPSRRGFGTRVIDNTVRGQLGGTVERRWEQSGLVVEVAVPLTRATSDADAAVRTAA
jgi:PAS domain S-box-containing protein